MNAKDKILSSIRKIFFAEQRPFIYKDSVQYKDYSNEAKYAYGKIMNIFSAIKKECLTQLVYHITQTFYTLSGVDSKKEMMTPDHTGVCLNQVQTKLIKIFEVTKLEKPAIHDIRLLFHVKGLRDILLSNSNNKNVINKIDKKSKDIRLKDIIHDDIIVKTTVHNNDKVTVMVACTENPITIEDPLELSKLTGGLTRVEERLQQEINYYYLKINPKTSERDSQQVSVPPHMDWIVKMWHFGRDSSHSYSGKLFEISWKENLDLFHVYSKKRRRIRKAIPTQS